MADNPYTSQTASGYNSNPPPDDGSTSEANRVTWAKIKEKLSDVVKSLAENINSNVEAAFSKTINVDPDQNNSMAGSLAFASSELTIASGSIVATRSHHTVDTEADAAVDDLSNITTASVSDGAQLLLRAENAARVVTIKHEAGGAGQIHLIGGRDIVLSSADTVIRLTRIGADWYQEGVSLVRGVPLVSKVPTAAGSILLNGDGTDFTMDGTYDIYEIDLIGLRVSTDSVNLTLQLQVGGVVVTASYNFYSQSMENSAGLSTEQATAGTAFAITETGSNQQVGNAATEQISGKITIFNAADTTGHKRVLWDIGYSDNRSTPDFVTIRGGGAYQGGTGAIDGFRLNVSSGNFVATGKVNVTGILSPA